MKKYLFLCIGILAFCSFVPVKKKSKNAKPNSSTQSINPEPKTLKPDSLYTDSAYWYKISFISTGSGIDVKAMNACKAFIKEFEAENKVEVIYKIAPWGREGEKDFCFAVNILSEKQAKMFREKSKQALLEYTLVRYKEICKCDKYREIIPETE